MPVICPAILATTEKEYRDQMHKVAHFAHRVQIDLTDGIFAEHKTVKPEEVWWPVGVKADVHLMFQEPLEAVKTVLKHKPHMVIIHAEAGGDFMEVVRLCKDKGVKVGVALMPRTAANTIESGLSHIDHVLIFSGNLGYQGGSQADLSLLDKAKELKAKKPSLEIGWDGGINVQNVSQLVFGGVDVLDVGGFIQHADDPAKAYKSLERIAEETGTT